MSQLFTFLKQNRRKREHLILSLTPRTLSSLLSTALLSILVITVFVSCAAPPSTETPLSFNPEFQKRGEYLSRTLAACGSCHGANIGDPNSALTGEAPFKDLYGEGVVPSLQSQEISNWSAIDLVQSLRKSALPDGEKLAVSHHKGFHWLSDRDAISIASYIRSLPTESSSKTKRRSISRFSRYTTGILEKQPDVVGYVPIIPKSDAVAYGNYLVDSVARCAECHNSPPGIFRESRYLEGGKEITRNGKTLSAPNITNSEQLGIGAWSVTNIVKYFKTGRNIEGIGVDSAFCPVNYYARASDEDLLAIATYLKSIEPSS